MNWSALGKMADISPQVQQHLLKVYATLCTGILAAGLGTFVDYKFYVAGIMTQLALFAAVIGLNFIHGLAPTTRHLLPSRSIIFVPVGCLHQNTFTLRRSLPAPQTSMAALLQPSSLLRRNACQRVVIAIAHAEKLPADDSAHLTSARL